MANKSMFPDTIIFDGTTWHMVYDPSCEATVMPSINEKDVQRMTCDAVKFPGRDMPIWLVMVSIVIPSRMDSTGQLIGARRMMGFRTFDRQPPTTYRVQPNELVYYVAEQSDGSAAQRFFNAVARVGQMEAAQSSKPDVSWCNQFAEMEQDKPLGVSNEIARADV